MARRYQKQKRFYQPRIQPRINERIDSPEVRVLSEKGENLGIMDRDKAIALAKERGLDLIEISASAKPPVAKITSFDKFRYEEEKRQKQNAIKQKTVEAKQVQVSIRSAKNDLELKAKKANEFLEEGRPVTIMMVLRGREKANKDWAKQKLSEFLKMITIEHNILGEPRFGGRGLTIQITKR